MLITQNPIESYIFIVENVWFGAVRGHSRLLEIAPFDRSHNLRVVISFPVGLSISCTLCLHLALFLRYSEILRWKTANFNLPMHLHLAPPLRVTPFEFYQDLLLQKTRDHAVSYHVVCVVLLLACDGQTETERLTDKHATAYTVLA